MTAAQRRGLLVSDAGWLLVAVVLLGSVLAAIALAPLFLDSIKKMKVVGLSVYGVGIVSWALYRAAYIGADVLRGRVSTETTHLPVSVSMIDEHRTFYSFRTDVGIRLRFPRASFQSLNVDDLYRIYFTPVSRRVVSFERLGPDYGVLPPVG